MAENIHIDLSEEIEQDLISKYQSLCEELTEKFNGMMGELEELCNETRYEPMVNVVNQTVELFDQEIYSVANQTFEEWLDGSGSFSAASENSQAGEEALNVAKQIEQNIRDMFENFWTSHPLGEGIQVDTSRPKIKLEDFDQLKEIYIKIYQDIETISEETVNQIVEQGNDDPTYNVIIPAVKAITEPVKNAFEKFSLKIDEARETSENIKQQQDSNNEEASEVATNTSAGGADIAESLKMYGDI